MGRPNPVVLQGLRVPGGGRSVRAAGRPAGALLENHANNVSTTDSGPLERRRRRWSRRAVLWRVSDLKRVAFCGRVPRSTGSAVTLRRTEGVGGWAGLQHCGSVWSCPVCAGRILVHRALEIGAVLGAAVAAGHPLGFVTLTMRHREAQALGALWAAAGKGWTRAITGRAWVEETEVEGWVRVWEVTHGRNGWHVHVHLVLVLDVGATSADLDRIASGMFGRWSSGLQAAGLDAPWRRGQEWHLVTGPKACEQLGEYLAKFADAPDTRALGEGLGLELTHTMPGRSSDALRTRPVWALLDDVATLGDADSLGLWHEWEKASKGRKQVGWSVGLRERFAPTVEDRTDDEIAGEELGSRSDDVIALTAEAWRSLVARPHAPLFVIEALEGHGVEGARRALEMFGVEHRVLSGDGNGGTAGGKAAPPPAPAGPGGTPEGAEPARTAQGREGAAPRLYGEAASVIGSAPIDQGDGEPRASDRPPPSPPPSERETSPRSGVRRRVDLSGEDRGRPRPAVNPQRREPKS